MQQAVNRARIEVNKFASSTFASFECFAMLLYEFCEQTVVIERSFRLRKQKICLRVFEKRQRVSL